jgi:hypothetical protein
VLVSFTSLQFQVASGELGGGGVGGGHLAPLLPFRWCGWLVTAVCWDASFPSALVDQAVASRRSPGTGRAASAAASWSMAALSCFWSSMNLGTGG